MGPPCVPAVEAKYRRCGVEKRVTIALVSLFFVYTDRLCVQVYDAQSMPRRIRLMSYMPIFALPRSNLSAQLPSLTASHATATRPSNSWPKQAIQGTCGAEPAKVPTLASPRPLHAQLSFPRHSTSAPLAPAATTCATCARCLPAALALRSARPLVQPSRKRGQAWALLEFGAPSSHHFCCHHHLFLALISSAHPLPHYPWLRLLFAPFPPHCPFQL